MALCLSSCPAEHTDIDKLVLLYWMRGGHWTWYQSQAPEEGDYMRTSRQNLSETLLGSGGSALSSQEGCTSRSKLMMLYWTFRWVSLHLLLPHFNFIYTQWLRVLLSPMPSCSGLSLLLEWSSPTFCSLQSLHMLASVSVFDRTLFILLPTQPSSKGLRQSLDASSMSPASAFCHFFLLPAMLYG